jgi:putative FmdB family regulatory protein
MPTYEFRCPKGHDFEKFFKTMSTAPSEMACPECGALASRLMSSGAGFAFKGSGFYLTDYGKNAHRGTAPTAKADSKAESKSDSKAESKSDSKSDTKSESKSESKAEPKAEKKAEVKSESPKTKAPSPKPKSE